jgi:hypothetical protein
MKQAPHAGIGLRLPHHRLVIEQRPPARWFEIHAENYMTEGVAATELEQVARLLFVDSCRRSVARLRLWSGPETPQAAARAGNAVRALSRF